MLNTTQTFYDNSVFKYRSTTSRITIQVFDTVAKSDISNVACNDFFLFKATQLYDEKKYDTNWATLEKDEFLLDGSLSLLPDEIEDDEQIGWWTILSKASGLFDTNPKLTIEFNNEHSTAGLTVYYDDFSYPLLSKAYWYRDNTLLASETLEGTSNCQVFTTAVNNYNKVVIEITKAKPYAFVKMSTIDYGFIKIITPTDLESASIKETCSLISNTITANTLKFNIFNYDNEYNLFDETNLFKYFKKGQQCNVEAGVLNRQTNEYEYVDMGIYYINSTEVSSGLLKITAYGILETLNSQTFYSNFYDNVTVENIAAEILDGYSYTIHSNVKDTLLTGYIPSQTKKEALKVLCIAAGAVAKETRDGGIIIYSPTDDMSTNQIIEADTLYEAYDYAPFIVAGEPSIYKTVKPIPYMFTIDRSQQLSILTTSLIDFYKQVNVTYKNYALSSTEEKIFNETVITDENGQALISHDACKVSSDSGQDLTHYVDYSILNGDPLTTYTVIINGYKYETSDGIASAYSKKDDGSAYDDVKVSVDLTSSNDLIGNKETAYNCAKWYLSQMQKRKDISFDWWAVATAEATDFCNVETETDGDILMEIDSIEYNLLDLTAKVQGVA